LVAREVKLTLIIRRGFDWLRLELNLKVLGDLSNQVRVSNGDIAVRDFRVGVQGGVIDREAHEVALFVVVGDNLSLLG